MPVAMKNWGKQEFAHGLPVSAHDNAECKEPVDPASAQFAWLSSLPIAAAIFRQTSDGMELISGNPLFSALFVEAHREPGLDLAALAERIDAMNAEKRDSHFECWTSPDPVSRRELEISIARFGERQDMFMLSLVDRTAEAVSRINLRREMLSDSLTGFFNRTGFEEEVELAIKNLTRMALCRRVNMQYC